MPSLDSYFLEMSAREMSETSLQRHCVKSVRIRRFSGPYFPVFGLNTEIYGVNLRIQSEYRKIRTKKNSVFGHFSRSEVLLEVK